MVHGHEVLVGAIVDEQCGATITIRPGGALAEAGEATFVAAPLTAKQARAYVESQAERCGPNADEHDPGPVAKAVESDPLATHDLRGRSPIVARLLAPPAGPRLSFEHRFFFWIPAEGLPVVIAHDDDLAVLPDLPGDRARYRGAFELRTALEAHIPREGVVLVEQAPFGQIADLAFVDEATLSLLRHPGIVLRSSIELANRFAGPLSHTEREEVRAVAADLAAVRTMLARSISMQPPESWEALWDRVTAHVAARGLVLSRESGLGLDAAAHKQRLLGRAAGPLAAGAWGRIDLWASRERSVVDLIVPASFDVAVAPLSEARATLGPLLASCEDEILRALDDRAARGRVLGSEAAELVYDSLRRRGLKFAAGCVAWPVGPVPRGTYACTLDADAFADPRELMAGGVWMLRLGVEQEGTCAWRTALFERLEGGIGTIARGEPVLAVPATPEPPTG